MSAEYDFWTKKALASARLRELATKGMANASHDELWEACWILGQAFMATSALLKKERPDLYETLQ